MRSVSLSHAAIRWLKIKLACGTKTSADGKYQITTQEKSSCQSETKDQAFDRGVGGWIVEEAVGSWSGGLDRGGCGWIVEGAVGSWRVRLDRGGGGWCVERTMGRTKQRAIDAKTWWRTCSHFATSLEASARREWDESGRLSAVEGLEGDFKRKEDEAIAASAIKS
jgi:hypothetical protein